MRGNGGQPAWQDAAIPGPDVGHSEVFARTLRAKQDLDRRMWPKGFQGGG